MIAKKENGSIMLNEWDVLAFNEFGQPCDGKIKGFLEGTYCEIYKNWLYVRNAESTIAEVMSGFLRVSGFRIEAARGSQYAIFVKVEAIRFCDLLTDGPFKNAEIRRMVGIGCHNQSYGKLVGILPATKIEFIKWLKSSEKCNEHDEWVAEIESTLRK